MPQDEKRRQKKLQARRSRRKEELRQRARVFSSNLRSQIALANTWPISASYITGNFDQGMVNAVLVRRGRNGLSAFSQFLIDLYCLGVKNAASSVKPHHVVEGLLQRWDGNLQNVPPEYVRKLVEDSIGYALSLGLPPHPDSAVAQLIFGDIDPRLCKVEFEFGQNGQPYFVAGPDDSPRRITEIMDVLSKTQGGTDNFRFVVPVATSEDSEETLL
jgi:hypothetical protein